MAQPTGKHPETVEDALARRVEPWQRWPSSSLAEVLRELGAVDRAVYEAVARTPTASLDGPVRRLSNAANGSRLWLGIAAALALLGGRRGRRAALEGVVSIGVTSAAVNLVVKPLRQRRRPDPLESGPCEARHVRMPHSTSFPSGHAASAFAFAYAVGRHLPGWPCRSGSWRPRSPTRASIPACTTRATWWPVPSWGPGPRRWSPRWATASPAGTRRGPGPDRA
jgi:membrane-associated phospholipid phosphatase